MNCHLKRSIEFTRSHHVLFLFVFFLMETFYDRVLSLSHGWNKNTWKNNLWVKILTFGVSCLKWPGGVYHSRRMLRGPLHHGGTQTIKRPELGAVITFKFLRLLASCHELGHLMKDLLPPRLLRTWSVSDWNCHKHIARYHSIQILYLAMILFW